jgi:hypothetical protein
MMIGRESAHNAPQEQAILDMAIPCNTLEYSALSVGIHA